ncbi:MAG: SDR family oxidoreductase [Bacilli bacterium]
MNRLNGKVAIITGSNSGVGEATAKLFSKEGATVVICARRKEALEKVEKEIKDAGGKVLAISTDISKLDQIETLFKDTIAAFGKVDILVNNAGVLDTGLKGINQYLDDDFDRVVSINEKGTMMCTREALKYMEPANSGSIVNVASVAGQYGCGGAVYVATKGAIIGVTKHTAMRFTGTGIRCNAVCPGTIITPMTTTLDQKAMDQKMFGAMMKHADIMGAKPCMPDDVANILLFLSSDESRAVTGQIIVTDFGADL